MFELGAEERKVCTFDEFLGYAISGRPPLFALFSKVILSGTLDIARVACAAVEARKLFIMLLSDEAVVAVA